MDNFSEQYKNLPIEKKIGQMFFIGLPTDEFNEETGKILADISPGGICLFARNIKKAKRVRSLLDKISETLPFQPFLSLDQEGGLVDRLRRVTEPIPSAKDISKTRKVKNAKKLAKITAETIRILGFNMNFAPVVDIIDAERLGFIMDSQQRTFGNSKQDVFKFSQKYLKTLQKEGVLGCLKHFPGIGAVEFDPHEELPSVSISHEDLFSKDISVFQKHFEKGHTHAIMNGHTTFPNSDLQEKDSNGKLLPSSLSPNIVTGLLRKELGFEGLALTDDLEMGAIIENYGIGEASKMSIQAGNDFILICNKPEAIYEGFRGVLNALETGELSEERIDESLERIFCVRQLLKPPLKFDKDRLLELSQQTIELKQTL